MSLRVDNLYKAYGKESLLEDISFEVAPGETVGILGPSGCGKTTLLRVVAGLDQDYSGNVSYDGVRISAPSRLCGVVFQDGRLLPWLRSWQNVAFAFDSSSSKGEQRDAAVALLESVGLPTKYANYWPNQLSGGMQRRVAIARVLAGQSKILLLDEPLSGIDIDSRTTIKRLFIELRSRTNNHLTLAQTATLLVTHDIVEAVALCSRIVILNRGTTTEIKDVRPIDLPFPRHESSEAFQSICQSVLKVLLSPANGAESRKIR